MTNSLVQTVATMEAEYGNLMGKSKADDELISVLKERVNQLTEEIEKLKNHHGVETSRLRNERDNALLAAKEVTSIIQAIGEQSLKGIQRMRGKIAEPVSGAPKMDERLPAVLDLVPAPTPSAEPELMTPVGSVEADVQDAVRPFIRRVGSGIGGNWPVAIPK